MLVATTTSAFPAASTSAIIALRRTMGAVQYSMILITRALCNHGSSATSQMATGMPAETVGYRCPLASGILQLYRVGSHRAGRNRSPSIDHHDLWCRPQPSRARESACYSVQQGGAPKHVTDGKHHLSLCPRGFARAR